VEVAEKAAGGSGAVLAVKVPSEAALVVDSPLALTATSLALIGSPAACPYIVVSRLICTSQEVAPRLDASQTLVFSMKVYAPGAAGVEVPPSWINNLYLVMLIPFDTLLANCVQLKRTYAVLVAAVTVGSVGVAGAPPAA
jgi:hypothetical protein